MIKLYHNTEEGSQYTSWPEAQKKFYPECMDLSYNEDEVIGDRHLQLKVESDSLLIIVDNY